MNDTELIHRLLAGQLRTGVCRLCLRELSDGGCASLGDTVLLPSGETTLGQTLLRTCPELGAQSWLNSALSDKVCMPCIYKAGMSPDAPMHRHNIEILEHYVEELYESLCNTTTLAEDAQTILIPLKAYNAAAKDCKVKNVSRDMPYFTVPIKQEIECDIKEENVVMVTDFEPDFDTDRLIVMADDGKSSIYEFTHVIEHCDSEIGADTHSDKDNSKLDKKIHATVDNSESKKEHLKKYVGKRPTLLECHICQKKYCSVAWLTQHTLKTHGVIICEDCDEQFKDKKSYNRHVDLHQVVYTCDLCGEGFKFKYDITLHLERHEKVKSQRCVCEVCGAHLWDATAKESHAARHERRSRVSFTCYYCGRGYLGVVSFEAHIRKHESARRDQFECELCYALYTSRAALAQHARSSHGALRPHACADCGKRFALQATLLAHRSHAACAQNVGTHRCLVCARSFVDARALKWHRRLHTGERPYRCDECGRDFISRNRRNQHALTAHTAPQLQCPLCPALFHLRSMVNTHIKKVHLTEHKRRTRAPRQRDVKWATEKVAFSELSVHVQTQLLDRSIQRGATSPL